MYTNTTIVSLWTLLPLSNIQIIMTEYRAILLHIPMALIIFLYKKINVMSEEEANVICSNNLIVFFS